LKPPIRSNQWLLPWFTNGFISIATSLVYGDPICKRRSGFGHHEWNAAANGAFASRAWVKSDAAPEVKTWVYGRYKFDRSIDKYSYQLRNYGGCVIHIYTIQLITTYNSWRNTFQEPMKCHQGRSSHS
jgi:hypothetical protein